MDLKRLTASGSVSPSDAASGLRLGDKAPPDRPYLVLNMVSTADGKATIEGRTGAIGNEADRQLFNHLRTQADAVMVGSRTVALERYGRIVRDPALREKRRREGLEPDPLACVVSGRLALTSDVPLLQDRHSRVVIVTSSLGELRECAARVEYLRIEPGTREFAPALRRLRSDHGVRSVLCEGGPTLNSTLLREGLVDELFLSLAPKLVGGARASTIVAGELGLPGTVELDLLSSLEAQGHLFLRYRVRR